MTASLRSAAVAAAAARLSYAALRARPPGGAQKWTRTNHRSEPVTLLEGPAVAIGGIAGALMSGASEREKLAVAIAGAAAAALGGYDDLAGNGGSKGFRGHLGALRKGQLTTGAVKIVGIGATGFAAAIVAGASGTQRDSGWVDRVINAGLIAGSANVINLFDLRPGRAIKVAVGASGLLALSPAGAGAAAAAAPLSAAAALLPEDLAEECMLGDAGANALGAMLGVAAATTLSRRTRLAALAAIVGLTASSEVVSFSRVIDRTGPLRWLDMLGRRPAGPPGQPADQQASVVRVTDGDGAGGPDAGNADLAGKAEDDRPAPAPRPSAGSR